MARRKSKKNSAKVRKHRWRQTGRVMPARWVEHLQFLPISEKEDVEITSSENDLSLSIISWNVLADSYCSRKSHPGLPRQYQDVVFDPNRRGRLIKEILIGKGALQSDDTAAHRLMPDIWALQEVDVDEILSKHLTSGAYEGLETPRSKHGGAGGKVDSVGIYYRKDRWTLIDNEVIRLDDLASMPAAGAALLSTNNNLQGLQRSFLRRNVALLARLQSIVRPDVTVVVSVAHLFWNPLYEYVKLCQAHHIMLKAHAFLEDDEPFLFCGDLNSTPGSSVHTYISRGSVNAKVVAPWYRCGSKATEDQAESSNENSEGDPAVSADELLEDLSNLRLTPDKAITVTKKAQEPVFANQQQIRYLLDYNLNRLCRWLRILGLDAGLETEEEERLRTKHSKIMLFDRCRVEQRVLVTTSSSLLSRANCPPGTYLINSKSLSSSWEIVLVHLLLTHGVQLAPSEFLSRCVVCNGNICLVLDLDLKRKILLDQQAPVEHNADLDVFQCDGCQQGYWWCDRPQSSASRVKGQATRLYQMCLRAHVPVIHSTQDHMFQHVNEEEERAQGWDWSLKGSDLLNLRLEVAEWLNDEKLVCPIRLLQSAYKDENVKGGEILPFTNVTRDFVGCLDYIFFDTKAFVQTKRLYVPKTHDELNPDQLAGGHLLPSDAWPSDHLAIGSTLRMKCSEHFL